MYKNKKIAVVVPVYNEEILVSRVISSMPDFIDDIILVDDQSTDKSVEVIEACIARSQRSIRLLKNEKNEGVGGSIAHGYRETIKLNSDVAVVMAGDAQMDPADLPNLLDPVVDGKAHYSKGNRLFTGEAYQMIPKIRYWGNAILSLLTKIVSGYWNIADSQSGYTAICREALLQIDWNQTYKRYGQPNDILVRLNVYNFVVKDVPVRPVYNIGEKSGLKIHRVFFTISWLLIRLFFWRMKEKYVIRDFHPLVFFYLLGFLLLICSAFLLTIAVNLKFEQGFFPPITSLAWMFSVSMGFQCLFFAMWFDMEQVKSHAAPIAFRDESNH